MKVEFIVDANLPYYFSLWNSKRFVHIKDLNDEWNDSQIWNYAKKQNLIIITKDADFSSRIILANAPPKVIHLRIGNMRMKEMYEFLAGNWDKIEELISKNKLVNVYKDKLESIN